MADNTEMTGIDNFSIQDTMSMGAGSQQLLNDLLSPETGTSNPDDITPIIKEVTDTPPPTNKSSKQTPPSNLSSDNSEEETKDKTAGDVIMNFLGTEEEEKSEEDEGYAPTFKSKKPADKTPEAPEDTSNITDVDDEQGSSQFSALAKDLYSLGVFTSEDGEDEAPITSPEEFLERFNQEKQKGSIEMVNNFIGQFGQAYQDAFQAIFVNGANPKEYFGALNAVEDFSSLDLTVESNQKLVLEHSLREQGFDEDDIQAEIERLTNYGDLQQVAERNHKVLVKKQAATLEQVALKAQRENQQKAAIRNEYINNVQTIISDKLKEKTFDGIPLNPKLANELHDFLLVDKYKTPTGEHLTDFDKTILELKRPENHSMKVKIGLLIKLLEKDPNLSTIQKTGVTAKTNSIFSEVVRQGAIPKTQNEKGAATRWFK